MALTEWHTLLSILLIFEWLLWNSGDFQLLHSGASQQTFIHPANEHAIPK